MNELVHKRFDHSRDVAYSLNESMHDIESSTFKTYDWRFDCGSKYGTHQRCFEYYIDKSMRNNQYVHSQASNIQAGNLAYKRLWAQYLFRRIWNV